MKSKLSLKCTDEVHYEVGALRSTHAQNVGLSSYIATTVCADKTEWQYNQ